MRNAAAVDLDDQARLARRQCAKRGERQRARGAAVVVERVGGHVDWFAADVRDLDELGGRSSRVVHPLGDDDLSGHRSAGR